MKLTHGECEAIINELEDYKRLKENIRMIKSDDEKHESSENNKNNRENNRNTQFFKKHFFNKYKMY